MRVELFVCVVMVWLKGKTAKCQCLNLLYYSIYQSKLIHSKLCWGQAMASNWTNELKGERWSSKTWFRGWHNFSVLIYFILYNIFLVACSFGFHCPKFSDSKGLVAWAWVLSRTTTAVLMVPAQRNLDARPETASKWKSIEYQSRNV